MTSLLKLFGRGALAEDRAESPERHASAGRACVGGGGGSAASPVASIPPDGRIASSDGYG